MAMEPEVLNAVAEMNKEKFGSGDRLLKLMERAQFTTLQSFLALRGLLEGDAYLEAWNAAVALAAVNDLPTHSQRRVLRTLMDLTASADSVIGPCFLKAPAPIQWPPDDDPVGIGALIDFDPN